MHEVTPKPKSLKKYLLKAAQYKFESFVLYICLPLDSFKGYPTHIQKALQYTVHCTGNAGRESSSGSNPPYHILHTRTHLNYLEIWRHMGEMWWLIGSM